ncbi:MAG: hypothetical protein V3R33_06315 [Anaerolineales bacterium]
MTATLSESIGAIISQGEIIEIVVDGLFLLIIHGKPADAVIYREW